MFKVLFIPINNIQARVYAAIVQQLNKQSVSYSIITMDKSRANTPQSMAGPALQEMGIPFKSVEEYGRKDPEAILAEEKPDILVVTQVQDYIVRFFMKAAQRKTIPVLLVQDAIFLRRFENRAQHKTFDLPPVVAPLTELGSQVF